MSSTPASGGGSFYRVELTDWKTSWGTRNKHYSWGTRVKLYADVDFQGKVSIQRETQTLWQRVKGTSTQETVKTFGENFKGQVEKKPELKRDQVKILQDIKRDPENIKLASYNVDLTSADSLAQSPTDNLAYIEIVFNSLFGKIIEDDEEREIQKKKQALENSIKGEADKGDVNSQVKLANLYFDRGEISKAIDYYTLAADQGNPDAQTQLGWIYESGTGVELNRNKAMEFYLQAAEKNHPLALNNLGMMHLNRTGAAQSKESEEYFKKSFESYLQAANDGNREAQYQVAFMYEHGRGIALDLQKAFEFYQRAADQRDANAQFKVGDMYEHGKGVPEDKQKARDFYQQAAKQGHFFGQTAMERLDQNR